ncbi:hypothetical protein OXI21_08110 [Ignatzschineria sp. RMDPL8A]|uniref:hypothetical protein n=1 Tax=Ignatzschineria sp. RMDPL8A TaxID=2999236 RepID=UPI00244665E2|nr:hypothetical protein [Ignatzschineria sp. RMDPL8A]MDG9730374.1 hypothetical protein [Ignatzschineria sp. RMDPL8A]
MSQQDLKKKNKLIIIETELKKSTFYSLIGRASKKMRGISFNYQDSVFTIEFFFDQELTEEEEEEMEYAHTEVLADIWPDIYDGDIRLKLTVVPVTKDIFEKKGNRGWIFLRKEYE